MVGKEVATLGLKQRRLLEMAANNKTGEEMEAETGVPAAQAILTVKRMLSDRDVWTEEERKALLLESLYKFKENLEQNLNWADPKILKLYLDTLTKVGDRLDRAVEISKTQLEQVTEIQARKLLSLYEQATSRARDILGEVYPEGTVEAIDLALQQGLREVAKDFRG